MEVGNLILAPVYLGEKVVQLVSKEAGCIFKASYRMDNELKYRRLKCNTAST